LKNRIPSKVGLRSPATWPHLAVRTLLSDCTLQLMVSREQITTGPTCPRGPSTLLFWRQGRVRIKTVLDFFSEFRKSVLKFFNWIHRLQYFSKMESVFGIFCRNWYRNRRGVLPTVSFGYRFLSEITGFVSWNFLELWLGFFLEFSSMWFFRIACTSLDKDYLFLYFLNVLRFFWVRWCWKTVEINDLVSRTNP
jgi:hypothetical protein